MTPGRKARWEIEQDTPDGINFIHLSRWRYFSDYINQEMLEFKQFIWRGHASDQWPLESTLDRLLRRTDQLDDVEIRQRHLNSFKYSSRGRRGTNPPVLQSDNDWWALGQHHGLATPLLDWTTSPYVAAYFAFFCEALEDKPRRAVFGISKTAFERKSKEIRKRWKKKSAPPVVEFIEPLSDENSRLVSQGGLFTRAPDGIDIQSWVEANYKGDDMLRLLKLTIPDRDREICLKSLNRMNINHLSLFPDLDGASKFTNLDLLISSY